ncbi:MAG TPA: response regulator transcription factor [Dyella sp.]|uniref:response regulator transcription factor n=1 Tax=Dyella sp. TaxID=1869338 RepID=UPI002B9A9366|nr:response regulator transcription factor [Dyella sp.]HUB90556.1 response regulator transcription factor [Dyella sp.]
MRVVIADDHEVVRIGLRTILEHSGEGYKVVGEASTGRELLKLLADTPCDLALIDFLMPEADEAAPVLDGVAMLRELRKQHPKLPIVVLTMMRNSAIFRTMYQEGVDAVVEKVRVVEELLVALRTVRAGRTYVSKRLGEHLAEGHATRGQGGKLAPALSVREAEVVRMFAQGRSITDIAALTHRSVKTISRQKRSAMEKLGLSSDGQLFEYARTHGLAG